jgi:hypothetical protein
MSPSFGWVPHWAICRNSVNLRVSKTDEYGRTIHENCCVTDFMKPSSWEVGTGNWGWPRRGEVRRAKATKAIVSLDCGRSV